MFLSTAEQGPSNSMIWWGTVCTCIACVKVHPPTASVQTMARAGHSGCANLGIWITRPRATAAQASKKILSASPWLWEIKPFSSLTFVQGSRDGRGFGPMARILDIDSKSGLNLLSEGIANLSQHVLEPRRLELLWILAASWNNDSDLIRNNPLQQQIYTLVYFSHCRFSSPSLGMAKPKKPLLMLKSNCPAIKAAWSSCWPRWQLGLKGCLVDMLEKPSLSLPNRHQPLRDLQCRSLLLLHGLEQCHWSRFGTLASRQWPLWHVVTFHPLTGW